MTPEQHARRLVTEKCLIATDVDQTILAQTKDRLEERLTFFRQLAPQLVEAARLGGHVGFITGNSMHELCSRFLDLLVEPLCYTGDLKVISRFHFFCNSRGIYFHFPSTVVDQAIQRTAEHPGRLRNNFWHAITISKGSELHVHSQFVDSGYVTRSLIPSSDSTMIDSVLRKVAQSYVQDLNSRRQDYEQKYDLAWVLEKNGSITEPKVELRSATYRCASSEEIATVQITVMVGCGAGASHCLDSCPRDEWPASIRRG
ncbi:MAG: hypothetical protein ABSH38_00950 [Verrucomicrobiota bacterium]|jgi:hypothetical protein